MHITRKDIQSWLLALLILLGVMAKAQQAIADQSRELIIAGGCFWCVEADFESVPGVGDAVSGFTGGHTENPTYPAKGTGHYEAVRIPYDPDVVSYRELLDKFFRSIDPTDDDGQFCDRGPSYRSAIFVDNTTERDVAESAKADAMAALGQEIVTPILDAATFYPVGEYHQDYYKSDDRILASSVGLFVKKKIAYKRYRKGCGRDARVRELWGDAAPFAGS